MNLSNYQHKRDIEYKPKRVQENQEHQDKQRKWLIIPRESTIIDSARGDMLLRLTTTRSRKFFLNWDMVSLVIFSCTLYSLNPKSLLNLSSCESVHLSFIYLLCYLDRDWLVVIGCFLSLLSQYWWTNDLCLPAIALKSNYISIPQQSLCLSSKYKFSPSEDQLLHILPYNGGKQSTAWLTKTRERWLMFTDCYSGLCRICTLDI